MFVYYTLPHFPHANGLEVQQINKRECHPSICGLLQSDDSLQWRWIRIGSITPLIRSKARWTFGVTEKPLLSKWYLFHKFANWLLWHLKWVEASFGTATNSVLVAFHIISILCRITGSTLFQVKIDLLTAIKHEFVWYQFPIFKILWHFHVNFRGQFYPTDIRSTAYHKAGLTLIYKISKQPLYKPPKIMTLVL